MAKTKKKTEKDNWAEEKKGKDILSELGLFVVEFEKLQKEAKKFIVDCFEKEQLQDTNLIEIIIFQATANVLTEYFRGIALYQIAKLETRYSSEKIVEDKQSKTGFKTILIYRTEEDRKKFVTIRKLIHIASVNLGTAGKIRNDLLHASYDNTTSAQFLNDKLDVKRIFQGVRSKIRSKGIENDHIDIEPKVFEKVIEMMMILRFLVGHIGFIINDDKFYSTANFSDEHLKLYTEIDIDAETKRLFKTTPDYHLRQYTRKRDRKAYQEYVDQFPDGIVPG